MFSIEFSNKSKKFLKKSDRQLIIRIMSRIDKLVIDPFPSDVKRVVINRKEKIFRIRVGDYRIEYSVLFKENILLIINIDKRPKAY